MEMPQMEMNIDIESSDAEEEEVLITEQLRKAAHSPPRKRRRLSGGQAQTSPDTDSTVSTDKENHDTYTNENANRKRRRPSAATQVHGNANSNSTTTMPIAAFPSTQPIQQKRNTKFGGRKYNIPINVNPGAIVRLELQNFLCHSNFSVSFHPNVNIIYGQNGSGKSAIEAGISMALGTNAKKSGRGKNINDVVKFGETHATIRIYLFNRGAEALPQYGDEIVVERKLTRNTRNGNSTFRVLNSALKVVSTGANAVREVCERLNINVENPCVVLKQSTAKEFLNSTKAGDKFKFFMQSSKLGDYQSMLEEAKENVHVAMEQQKQTKGSLHLIREKYEDCKQQYDLLEQHEQMEKRVEHYQCAEKWMKYHGEVEGLARFEADDAKCDNHKQKWQRALQQRTEKIKQDIDRLTALQTEMKEYNASLSQYGDPITAHKRDQKKLDERRADIARVISAKEKFITRCGQRMRQHQRELDAVMAEMANDQRGRQLADVQKKLQTSVERLEELRHQQPQFQEQAEKTIEMKQSEDELNKLRSALSYQKRDRDQIRSDFQSLAQNQNREDWFLDPVLRNHRSGVTVQQMQAEITRNAHRFSRPPVGPLGAHVEMVPATDPDEMQRRIQIVQTVLGRNMFAYLVSSSRDQGVLKDIMKRAFGITINCVQFEHRTSQPFRVHANPFENYRIPDADGPLIRVLDMFNIRDNNAWIFNALVTACNPERAFAHGTVLVAKAFLSHLDEHRLRRVQCLYTFREPKGGLFRVSKKRSSISGTPVSQYRPILQSDTKQQQEWMRTQLNDKTNEITAAEQRIGALQRVVQQHDASVREATRQLQSNKRAIAHLDKQIGTLQRTKAHLEEQQEDDDELQQRVQELHGNIDDEKVTITNLEEELAPVRADHDDVLQKLSAVKLELKAVEDRLREVKRQHESKRTQYSQMAGKLKNDRASLDKIPLKIQQLDDRKAAINQEWDAERAKCEQLKSTAQDCGEEVTPENYPRDAAKKNRAFTLAALKKERERMQSQMSAYEQRSAPAEDVRSRFVLIKPKYETHQRRMDTTNRNVNTLTKTLGQKRKELDAMKQQVQRQLSKEFALIMRTQGHNGALKVDYDKRELDMEVHMKSHDGGTRVVNTRTLSGGERSFSQVALIMALQKFSGSPMCIYDEFDVFMDSVNRCNSIKILLKAALGCDPSDIQKKNVTLKPSDRQYLFITPNDISPMLAEGNDDLMSIHALEPPRKTGNGKRS